MWGAIGSIGSFLGGAGSLAGALGLGKGGDSHSKIAKRQQAWTREYALAGPSWNVEGLRRAGLNPILAAKEGLSPNSAVAASANNVRRETDSDVRASSAQSAMAMANIKNIHEDTKLKKAETANVKNDTILKTYQQWNIEADTQLKTELKQKTIKEVQKIVADTILTAATTEVQLNTVQEIKQRVINLKQTLKIDEQHLREMMAKYPALLVQKEISETEYYKIMKYIEVSLPTVNSASGALGAIGIYRKGKDMFKGITRKSKPLSERRFNKADYPSLNRR